MVIPVRGVFAHEFGQRGEDNDALDRQLLALERESRTDIDVVCGRPCWFWRRNVGERPLWERRVGCVEGEGIGSINGDVNLRGAIEVWLEPANCR